MRNCIALSLVAVSCHGKTSTAPRASEIDGPPPLVADEAGYPSAPLSSSAEGAPDAPSSTSASPLDTATGRPRHRFHKTTLTAEDLTRLVSASPELAKVGADATFFDPGDMQYLTRSKAAREDVSFTTLPVIWSPAAGMELLVVTGRGKAASFIAAWWLAPGSPRRLASSFVILGEVAPLALAYQIGEPTLWWTSCWRCSGETGHLSLREDGHVVIVQD